MIKSYPRVLGESETLDLVLAGKSIARYGDGEFKVAMGGAAKAQEADATLAKKLRRALVDSGECLIGIPNIHEVVARHPVDQKVTFWSRFLTMNGLLEDRKYVSAFITRPDSAPWIDTPDYWTRIESLWKDREVTLVRGSSKSLVGEDLVGARRVNEVITSGKPQPDGRLWHRDAFSEYESLMSRIGTPERVLLCLGPAATAMAVDLCAKGVHAVDLGHVGLFLKKHRLGLPMWLSKDDKRVAV